MEAQLDIRRTRAGRRFGNFFLFVIAIVLVGFVISGTAHAAAAYTIVENTTGGDCTLIGNWDASTATCTLTEDISVAGTDGIHIDSDNITLDGDGHTLNGNGASNNSIGIFILNKTHGKIIGMNIINFNVGLAVSGSNYVISANHVSYNLQAGVQLVGPDNFLINNHIYGNGSGVLINSGYYNTLVGNVIAGNGHGIEGWGFVNSLVVGNTIDSNYTGLYLDVTYVLTEGCSAPWEPGCSMMPFPSAGNQIFDNNFTNNTHQVYEPPGYNANSFAGYNGGNYWSSFDETTEGCNDVDPVDGFCDAVYEVVGFGLYGDYQARLTPIMMTDKPPLTLSSTQPLWASYADYLSRSLTVRYSVSNKGVLTVYDVTITGGASTNYVSMGASPGNIGEIIAGDSKDVTIQYHIPADVQSFRTVLTANARDIAGTIYTYP